MRVRIRVRVRACVGTEIFDRTICKLQGFLRVPLMGAMLLDPLWSKLIQKLSVAERILPKCASGQPITGEAASFYLIKRIEFSWTLKIKVDDICCKFV